MKKVITLGSGGRFEENWIMHDIVEFLEKEGVIKLEDGNYRWINQDAVLIVEVGEE